MKNKQYPAGFVLTTGALDMTGHAPDCELWEATIPICTAEAMRPGRKVVYWCTCGKHLSECEITVKIDSRNTHSSILHGYRARGGILCGRVCTSTSLQPRRYYR